MSGPPDEQAFGDRWGHPGCHGCQMCIGTCLDATDPDWVSRPDGEEPPSVPAQEPDDV